MVQIVGCSTVRERQRHQKSEDFSQALCRGTTPLGLAQPSTRAWGTEVSPVVFSLASVVLLNIDPAQP